MSCSVGPVSGRRRIGYVSDLPVMSWERFHRMARVCGCVRGLQLSPRETSSASSEWQVINVPLVRAMASYNLGENVAATKELPRPPTTKVH